MKRHSILFLLCFHNLDFLTAVTQHVNEERTKTRMETSLNGKIRRVDIRREK